MDIFNIEEMKMSIDKIIADEKGNLVLNNEIPDLDFLSQKLGVLLKICKEGKLEERKVFSNIYKYFIKNPLEIKFDIA